ncbi:microtubule-associated protein 2-like X2, partial [Biomphalaria pfeifferi]
VTVGHYLGTFPGQINWSAEAKNIDFFFVGKREGEKKSHTKIWRISKRKAQPTWPHRKN